MGVRKYRVLKKFQSPTPNLSQTQPINNPNPKPDPSQTQPNLIQTQPNRIQTQTLPLPDLYQTQPNPTQTKPKPKFYFLFQLLLFQFLYFIEQFLEIIFKHIRTYNTINIYKPFYPVYYFNFIIASLVASLDLFASESYSLSSFNSSSHFTLVFFNSSLYFFIKPIFSII